ncbi:peptidoglycan-binding protein [Leifsonia sp. TF02-11]|uniref:peptidoglycan-binding domain-containing protein n=1 Tax=Leifsonia sp. TF02-11 TaxID=2815212 RepID=UPI001AA1066B|nr:peptidoglycan-binding domain-containing protein [Leifsonia sp. TF02-11]MBO1737239.1 hypothetical protein [Leifsonia sp. TF02-11]
MRPTAPAAIAPSASLAVAPVKEVQTLDEQPATLAVTASPAKGLTSSMAGTVTSTLCIAGGSATSGNAALSINDEMIVYLATSRPLWRDLAVGDVGADVRSLQEELVTLGHAIRPDGRFGTATLRAVVEVAEKAGASDAATWSVLPHDRVIWLPARAVQTVTCDRRLGDRVSEGDAVATLPSGVAAAKVSPLPANALSGDRVVVVGDLTLPVDASGSIAAAESLVRLAQSTEYREHADRASTDESGAAPFTGGSAGAELSITYRLATPVSVISVPAASVYDTHGAAACVAVRGRGIAMTIVGSQLGQTFVVPEQDVRVREVDLDTRDASACRK